MDKIIYIKIVTTELIVLSFENVSANLLNLLLVERIKIFQFVLLLLFMNSTLNFCLY